MNDRNDEMPLTASQMIRRAVKSFDTMTLEEKLAVLDASEKMEEVIKARFVAHWRYKQGLDNPS